MRTTLNLEDDIYLQLRHLALTTKRPFGEVASEMLRKAFNAQKKRVKIERSEHGLPILPVFKPKKGARVITDEFINQLREEEGV